MRVEVSKAPRAAADVCLSAATARSAPGLPLERVQSGGWLPQRPQSDGGAGGGGGAGWLPRVFVQEFNAEGEEVEPSDGENSWEGAPSGDEAEAAEAASARSAPGRRGAQVRVNFDAGSAELLT